MNILNIAGKFLDQPLLVAKFQKSVPYILSGAACAYGGYQVKKAPIEDKKNTSVRVFSTLSFTVASALAAPKITDKIFRAEKKNLNKDGLKQILSPKQVKKLYETVPKDVFNKLIPEPENITSKEIFSEIGRLSLLGLIPVVGGITGGIVGDNLTDKNWKDKLPDKIKEGSYQYLANIFLCNIGAGSALAILEKMNIRSKCARALGMIGGILTTGVIGGSSIANFIGEKIINPIFNSQEKFTPRHPEALDIGLHTDDIATVAVMSGLKWIEPALPLMYAVSGYRAGIGYRNNKPSICKEL